MSETRVIVWTAAAPSYSWHGPVGIALGYLPEACQLGDVRLLEFFLRHHGVIAAVHRNSKVLSCIPDFSLIQYTRLFCSSQA